MFLAGSSAVGVVSWEDHDEITKAKAGQLLDSGYFRDHPEVEIILK